MTTQNSNPNLDDNDGSPDVGIPVSSGAAAVPGAPVSSGAPASSSSPGGALGLLKRPTLFDGPAGEGSAWNEEDSKKTKRTNPLVRAIVFVGLGLFSFLFFLYLTFPYGVIKEVVVSTISENLRKSGIPVRVSIGSLRPHWVTGLHLKGVQVTNAADADANLKLGEVTVRLNLLPLLIGRATVTGHVTQVGGRLDLRVDMPILGAIKGDPSPSLAKVEFKNFALAPLFNHGLALARGSKDPGMVLVLPLLAKTTAGGSLSGSLVLDNPETSHFGRAKGTVDLRITDGFLHIDDQTLKIPKQNFSDAKMDVKFENNAIVFNDTNFKAEDIGVGLAGKVALPELPGNPPDAELDLSLSMHGEIEKNLGFILPNMLRCKPLTAGELKAKLTGPVSQMRCD